MNKKLLSEINKMRYFLGYERGLILSEQKNFLNEEVTFNPKELDDQSWTKAKEWFKQNHNYDPQSATFGDEKFEWIDDDVNYNQTYRFWSDGKVKVGNKYIGYWKTDEDGNVIYNKFMSRVSDPTSGYIQDTDTDRIDAIYQQNKVAGVGASGPIIKEIQHALLNVADLDFSSFNITNDYDACKANVDGCDGIYGRKTKEAVKAFQGHVNLEDQSGIYGRETDSWLFDE
jgi:hypothetical protein